MSSQWAQGVAPPPDGIEPNFVNPTSQTLQHIIVHAVFLTLSTLSVLMRIYTRVWISRAKLGVDDYLCVFSLAATATYSGLLLECFQWGIGRHIWDIPAPPAPEAAWLITGLMYQTIAAQFYLIAATAIKLSLLFLYRRLFNLQKKAKWFVNGGIGVVLAVNLALFLAVVFFCIPVQKAWDSSIDGHCTDPAPVTYFTGVWNFVVDVYVLVLPIPLLWGLNMGSRQKLRLAAVFGIGIFACSASLVRLAFTSILQSDNDSTWNIASISLWATLELNVGLICTCLMLLPGFLRHVLPDSTKSYLRSISFSRSQTAKKSFNQEANQWPGYHQKVSSESHWQGYENKAGSGSQSLIPLQEPNQIMRTNTYMVETTPAPTNLGKGKDAYRTNPF